MLSIITIPNPILRQRATAVVLREVNQPVFQTFLDDLIVAMKQADGIGIAAPQVGRSERIFIVSTADGPLVMINPMVFWRALTSSVDEEGCLSIPDVYGLVKRATSLYIRYYDRAGKPLRLRARGLLARVILHELDHINGILFIDKMIKQTAGPHEE